MRGLVLLGVLVAGLASLALEVGAAQLLAPYVGASINVWGVLIGTVLLCLSAGYWLGGRVADRWPCPWAYFLLGGLAGLWMAALPLVAGPLAAWAVGAFAGLPGGAVLSTLVLVVALVAAPTALFGAISPFAIRLLLHDVASGGRTAGRVFLLATAGSLAGTILPVFVTIPYLGTAQTLLGAGLLAGGLGAGGLAADMLRRSARRGTVRVG